MKKIMKKIKDAGLPFMILYSCLYLLFASIVFYFVIIQGIVEDANSRLSSFFKNPFEQVYFLISGFLIISYPITVILSLFSISKKLTKIENIISQKN